MFKLSSSTTKCPGLAKEFALFLEFKYCYCIVGPRVGPGPGLIAVGLCLIRNRVGEFSFEGATFLPKSLLPHIVAVIAFNPFCF